MNEDRVTQFEEEVATMKVRGANVDVERWLRIGALVGLLGGIILVIVGGFMVSGTTVDADQRALVATSTMIGLALTIAGTALFVRVSIGRLLRYWLIRLVHEHRTETDRLIAAIERRGDGGTAGTAAARTTAAGTVAEPVATPDGGDVSTPDREPTSTVADG